MRLRAVALVAASLFQLIPDRSAHACAPAPRQGEQVRIDEETAVIVWDEARKLEHFIRTATFATSSTTADFGFLVPTPTQPELAEVPFTIFAEIEKTIEDRRPVVTKRQWRFGCMMDLIPPPRATSVPPVRVLEQKVVAGYDAAVLEADSATALAHWLAENQYGNRPELGAWLEPYVSAHWKVTAFRFRPSGAARFPSGAVRMSFQTERPFFPYREPADAGAAGERRLRVHLVAARKMQGTLGDGAKPWAAGVEYADAWPGASALLGAIVPEGALPAKPWLTSFLDPSTTRAPGELFFSPAPDDAPVPPSPRVELEDTWIPVDLFALVVVTGFIVGWRKWRRARRTGTAAPPRSV
ncbi:MAG TPA: DUF2330 domain-containing protein [Haliangiales bacterium]|nr:DUF2330 domain-containing protein [Haliangiales bacterium]